MRFPGKQFALTVIALASIVAFGQSKADSSPQSIYLSGRLTDSSGTPIANATVTLGLRGGQSDLSKQRTVSNGRYVVEASPKRNYTLRFVAPGFKTVILPVTTQTQDVELKDVVAIATTSPVRDARESDVLPSDLIKQVKDDLGVSEVQDCITESGEVFEQMISTERLNLAARKQALLVAGRGPCFAGANNGELLIYVRFGSKWRKVFEESGSRIETLSSRTFGFPDIALWQHSSAFESVRSTYHFDESSYIIAGCDLVRSPDPAGGDDPKPEYIPCSWNWKQTR